MITRAQAEALLTLAESLEACERQGLTVAAEQGLTLYGPEGAIYQWREDVTGVAVRLAVNDLVPKHTGS